MIRNTWICLMLVGVIAVFAMPTALCQTPPKQPDLAFQQTPEGCLVVSPSVVTKGGTVHASVTVVNRKSAPVDSFDVEFVWRRVDKQEMCGFERLTIADLHPQGYEASVVVDTSDLTPGTYELAVWIDPENRVAEEDETNNRCSTKIEILSLRPEVHPINVYTDRSSPIEWGETVRILTELENTGDREAGEFHVAFGITPISWIDPATGRKSLISIQTVNDADPEAEPARELVFTEVDAAIPRHPIQEENWIPFGSVVVAGLERDAHLTVHGVLDSAAQLDALLGTFLNPAFLNLASKTAKDLTDDQREELARISEELARIKTGITTYAIRAKVGKPYGLAEQDPGNNTIIGYLSVEPSTLHLAELRPVGVTFTHKLPLEWGHRIGARVSVANVGSSAADPSPEDGPIQVWFYIRKIGAGTGDWGKPLEPVPTIDRIQIEEGRNAEDVSINLLFPSPGSYELRVWVDPTNVIPESNEDNNEMTVGLSVQGSELHPQSIELAGAPIRQGDSITVISQIENTGDKPAETFTVGFFIDEVRFDTFYYSGEGLTKNGTVKVRGVLNTADLPLEFDREKQAHKPLRTTLRVFVDPDDRIPETDEANNVISMPLVILPPEPRQAELHPVEVTLDPPSPVPVGQGVLVRATVRNSGNIDAERFQVKVALGYGECAKNVAVSCSACQNGDHEGETDMGYRCCQCVDVEDLPRGAKTVIERWFSTAGLEEKRTYWVSVSVDPPNSEDGSFGEIDEMDENNNELIVYFTVGTPTDGAAHGKPNLTVRSLTVNPPSPVDENTPIRVTAEVANTGGEAAGSFDIRFRIHGAYLPSPNDITRTCAGLQPGASKTETISIQLRRGTYELEVAVDPKNRIVESVETDNQITRTLSVGVGPQRADLVPITVHFDPSSPKVGDNVRVVATVENQGSGVAGEVKASFSVLLDEYVTFAHATDGALGSGGQTDLLGILDTKAMRLEEGTYKVRILVDPDNKIVEENEANNTFVDELQIAGRGPTVTLVEGTSGVVHHLAISEQAAMVYLASENGKLFRVQAGNMQASLAFDAGNPITAFALDEGSSRAAYLGTSTGKLLVYGLDRGEEVCHVSVDENNSISAVAFDRFGNIYAGTSTNVVSVAGDCGSLRWQYGLGEGEVVTALAVHNARNRVYVATSMPSSGRLYAFALTQTGVENPVDPDWELTFSSPLSTLALDGALDGRIWVGTENGEVQAVTFTGRLDSARTYMTGGAVTGIVLDLEHRDPLYATTDEGKLYGLNLAGELRWVFPLEGTAAPISSAAAVDGSTGDVIFGTNDGSLYTVDSQGNPVWAVEGLGDSESGVISSPVVGRVVERDGAKVAFYRVIYFGTSDGKVYLAKEAF